MTNAPRLLLDEHYGADIARALRAGGHDVVAVVEDAHLRSQPDAYLARWAADHGRRIVTENVKDFRPLLVAAHGTGSGAAALLCVPTRRFPRGDGSRTRVILEALEQWLSAPDSSARPDEDWLV